MTGALGAVLAAARDRADLVRDVRRDLHRIPELAFQEAQTTRYVEAFLEARGIAFERFPWGTGGVAVLGRGDGGVLLRADLDGLPLDEETRVPFRSRRPGCMHACGHDAHAAMLLAAADALAAGAVPLPGRAVLVFQPAEEGFGGARRMLDAGLLERHPVAAAVAVHVWPGLATGRVGIGSGPLLASMDRVRLVFSGRGGHGAFPHACVDPVVMAAEGVLALQTLVSRRVDPRSPAVLTVGAIRGGAAANVIPEEVELLATVRAFEGRVRDALLGGMERIGRGIAAAHGGGFGMELQEHYPVTAGDPGAAERLRAAVAAVLGEGVLAPPEPTLGAEDMGMILERVPGCFVQLGASPDPTRAEPLHSPRFDLDEECLPVGVAVLLAAAAALLPGA